MTTNDHKNPTFDLGGVKKVYFKPKKKVSKIKFAEKCFIRNDTITNFLTTNFFRYRKIKKMSRKLNKIRHF